MIGYDIVSLENLNKIRWGKRYIQKALTPNEASILEINKQLFSAYWSIKESAYKCVPPNIQSRFNPHQFEITNFSIQNNGSDSMVNYKGRNIEVITNFKQGYTESVACWNPEQLCQIVVRNTTNPLTSISLLLENELGPEASIEKNNVNRPLLKRGGFSNETISISHDGIFCGFAYLRV